MQDLENKIRQLNPNKEPLTPELLKKFPGFENFTEEQLQERVFTIHTLCELGYEFLQQMQSHEGKKECIEITPNFSTKQAA